MHVRTHGIVLAVPCFVVFAGTGVDAATIRVPADQPTIQAGIDAATAPGDVVLVAPGTYTGLGNHDIELRGRDIVVRSESGAAVTIMDCEDLGRGFHVHQGETAGAVIECFTVLHGRADSGAGMRIAGASPAVTACVIMSCRVMPGSQGNVPFARRQDGRPGRGRGAWPGEYLAGGVEYSRG